MPKMKHILVTASVAVVAVGLLGNMLPTDNPVRRFLHGQLF